MNQTPVSPAAAPPVVRTTGHVAASGPTCGEASPRAVVLVALYTAFMLWFSYSEGERAGVLQKFSKRGWICKTYEGELALYVVGGVAPQIWHFSARDESVLQPLRAAVGQQVRIHYEEHRGLPTDCFGETDYFATGFEVIGPPPSMPPSPACRGTDRTARAGTLSDQIDGLRFAVTRDVLDSAASRVKSSKSRQTTRPSTAVSANLAGIGPPP